MIYSLMSIFFSSFCRETERVMCVGERIMKLFCVCVCAVGKIENYLGRMTDDVAVRAVVNNRGVREERERET
jgi:hypothetical protein